MRPMHPVTAVLLLLMLSYLGWGRDPAWADLGFSVLMLAVPVLMIRGFFLFIGDVSRIGRKRR